MNARIRMFLEMLPFTVMLFILPFPGTVAMRLLCLSGAIGLAIWFWRRWDTPPVPCKPILAAWGLLAASSLLYAVDVAYSLGEIKNEIGYAMAAFLAYFSASRSRDRLQVFALVVVLAATVISVWALLQRQRVGYWDDGARHGGVGSFATLAVISAPMALIVWQRARRSGRVLLLAAGTVVLWAVIASGQRIIWLAYGVQLAVLVCLLAYAGVVRFRALTVALLAAGILSLSLTFLLVAHDRKVDQSPVEFYDLGNDFRLQQWGRIMDRILEDPLSGAGFGREGMKKAYPDLVPPDPPMSLMWHPHNVFLTYGVAMGIPGMLVLALLFGSLGAVYAGRLRSSSAGNRLLAAAGIMLISGVVVRNLTNDFFLRDGALMFWALNGALLGHLLRYRET